MGADAGTCCACGLAAGDDVPGALSFACMDGGRWEGEADELWASSTGVPAGGEAAGLGCSAASPGFSSAAGALSARERLSRAGGVGSVIVIGGREEGEGDAAREYRYRSLLAA